MTEPKYKICILYCSFFCIPLRDRPVWVHHFINRVQHGRTQSQALNCYALVTFYLRSCMCIPLRDRPVWMHQFINRVLHGQTQLQALKC